MSIQLVRGRDLWGFKGKGATERTAGRLGVCKATGYVWLKQGLLPPPVKLSSGANRWPAHELDAVLAARISGKSDAEIKALVSELVAARAHLMDQRAA